MAVPHSAPSTGAEMNMVQFNENRSSWMGERELRLKDHRARSVGAGAALGSVDSKEQERGHVRSTDDSLLGEKQHPEEQEPSARLPLSEKIRLSILHIQKRQRELSELSRKLKERREVSPQIKENLKVVLGGGQPADHELEEQLGQSLNPEIPEEEKDGGEKLSLAPSVTANGLSHVEEEDVLQASRDGEPKTSCSVFKAGDTLQPPCTSATVVVEAEVPAEKAAEDQNDPEDEDTVKSAAPRVSTEHLTLDLVPTQKFQEWSSSLSCLRHRMKSLLAQNRFPRLQEQRLQESHVAWHRLAKNLAYQLDLGQHSDGDPEEMQALDSSAELNEQEEVVEVISESVAELPFLDTGLALAQLPQENHLDTAVPAKEPAVSPGPEGTGRAGDRIERAGDVEIARVGDGIAGAINIEIAGGGLVEIAGPRKDGIVGAGEFEIARAGDVEVAGDGDIEIAGARDVMIAGARDVMITGAGDVEIAGAGDVEIAGAGDGGIAGAGDVVISETGDAEIAGVGDMAARAGDVKIAGARDADIVGVGDVMAARAGDVMAAGAEGVMIAGVGGVMIAGARNAEIAGAEDGMIAGAGDVMAARPGDVDIAGAGDVEIAGARDVMIEGAGDVMIAGAIDAEIVRVGDVVTAETGDAEIVGVGDVMIAGAGDVMIAGAGDVVIAETGDAKIVGAGDVMIAGAGDDGIAGAGDTESAGSGDVGIAGAGNAEIAGAGDPVIAGAGDAKIAGAGDVEIAGAKDVKIAGARDITIAGAGDSEIAVTGEVGKAREQEARKVLRVFTAVMNIKARMCALLWAAFQKWRATILSLRRSIRDLLSRKDPVRSEGQSHQDPAEGREMAEHLGLQLCSELDLEASVGMKSPHETEAEAPAEPRDAPRGPQFLSLPEPAAALKQTAIQGCSRGAWPADSPALRLIMQRSLLIQPRRMLLL